MTHRFPWNAVFRAVIVAFTVFVLLDTFVIPRSYSAATTKSSSSSSSIYSTVAASTSSSSTSSQSPQVTVTTEVVDGTTVYVADIVVSSPEQLLTAFANGTYGKNITETTSSMAEDNDALLAINGDYYGSQNSGYVIRNGVLYRSTAKSSSQEDLVIYSDGTWEIVTEGSITAQELLDNGAWQVFSFGPGLVEDGQVAVTTSEEVGKAMASNPRTAIGMISENHYVLVVADGRTSESEGLSLYQLAQYMQSLGVQTAYNLDGGGSSTMYYNGEVINNPTTSGNSTSERKVSDIVYIQA